MKKLIATIIFCLGLSTPALAAMAINSTSAQTFTAGASATKSFTNTAGNCMVVEVIHFDTPGIISGITYNGVAMTLGVEAGHLSSIGEHVVIYYLASPATGTNNVVVSFGGAGSAFGGDIIMKSFTGCHASPLGNTAATGNSEATSASSPFSLNISMTSGSVAVSAIFRQNTEAFTDGSGQTSVYEGLDVGGSQRIASSYKVNATSMSYSWSGGSKRTAMAVLELKAAAEGGGGDPSVVRHRVLQ